MFNIRRLSKFFRNSGLWTRLALIVTVGFLIFFTTFGFLSMRIVNDSTKRILGEQLVLTQITANQIDALLVQAFHELEKATTFARFDPQADDLTEEYHMLAHTYGRVSAFSLGVYFYDAKGKVILAEPYDASIIGADHSSKSHILRVMESGQRSVSSPFVEPKTGIPAVALTIPIKGEKGELISMLSGLIDLSSSAFVSPIEQASKLGHTGHAELVDSQAIILVSTYPGAFLKPGEHKDFYKRMMAERLTKVATVIHEDYYADGETDNETMHVMAFAPLSEADWGVAVGGGARETFAPIVSLRNSLFIFGSIALVIILMATLIGTRYLVGPIKKLTQSAQDIAGGNMTASIEMSGAGEIGVLGRSLQQMRLKLKESFDEIQDWNIELEGKVGKRTKELEQMAEEVSKLKAMQELDRIKSEFISSISHELRTPLGLITGYATTLLRSNVPHSEETRQEFLQIIKEEGEKLCDLVENLLDTSRIQAGKFTVEKTPTDIAELVRKVVGKVRSVTGDRSFLLHLDSLPSVPGDSHRLEQVLHNLLDNAIKYSPQGSEITVRGEVKADHVQISVADKGQGIPQSELTKIFSAFYRVPNADSQKVRGAGLGLVICRAIVEAHGGSIWTESNQGEGSIFRFTLPLREIT